MVTLDTIVTVAKDVIFQELDGEAVLLDMQTETYFGLNPTATQIWQLLSQHGSVRSVAGILRDEYNIAEKELEDYLLDYVERLKAKGLIKIRDA